MNSSSKTPPRFVPTLTEVVPVSVDPTVAALGEAIADLQASPPSEPVGVDETPAPGRQPAFHSLWLTDGVPGARGLSAIPRNLPPLPDSLPPQQSLSGGVVPQHIEQQEEVDPCMEAADLLDAKPALDKEGEEAGVMEVVASAFEQEELSAHVSSEGEEAAVSPVSELSSKASAPAEAGVPHPAWSAKNAEEQWVQSLMQRVDQLLEQRLREAISAVLEEQGRSMVLQLRSEVESVVRQSVRDAMVQELPQARV